MTVYCDNRLHGWLRPRMIFRTVGRSRNGHPVRVFQCPSCGRKKVFGRDSFGRNLRLR